MEPVLPGENQDWMFVFHWQPDGSVSVLHCGSKAATILGTDIWAPRLGEVENVFQDVLLSGVKQAFSSGRYGTGRHTLSAADLGAGISLSFQVAVVGDGSVFWRGYVVEDEDDLVRCDRRTKPDGPDLLANPSLRWLTLANSASDFVWFKDVNGRYLYTNAAFDLFHGLPMGRALGKTDADLFGEERARHVSHEDQRAIESGMRSQCREATQGANSSDVVTLDISRQPITGADGRIRGLLCTGRDRTEHWRRERELSREIHFLKGILNKIENKISYFSAAGDPIYMNKALMDDFGMKPDHFGFINVFSGKTFEHKGNRFRRNFAKAVETRQPVSDVLDFLTVGGKWTRAALKFIPELDDNGEVAGILVLGDTVQDAIRRDIAADMEEATADQLSAQLKTLLASIEDAVWIVDSEGRFLAANEGFSHLTGILPVDLIGQKALVGSTELPPEISGPYNTDKLKDGAVVRIEEPVRSADDNSIHNLDISLSPIKNSANELAGFVGIARDISSRKKLELELASTRKSLTELVYNDPVTGLPNEKNARDMIAGILLGRGKEKPVDAILLIKIDHFGGLNDSISHAADDILLKRIADNIRQAAPRCYNARFGNDEFLLHAGLDNHDDVGELATRILDAINKPFFSERRYLTPSASIGITLAGDPACGVEDLLAQARMALRQAYKAGRNTFYIFDSYLADTTRDRFTLEADIRLGLEKGQFEAHYQPKIDLATNAITGAEALMRWKHPGRGNIPPAMFIPLAEETGLIRPLGEKVLADSCQFAKEWNERSDRPMTVAINLSPWQLMSDDFMALLRRTLKKTHCRAEWIELEITESLLLSDHIKVEKLLGEAVEIGVGIAIDDFCTGYSAMTYLIDYPINTLKIDRSFVQDVSVDKKKAVLLKAIFEMARGLNMNTVAEGIETTAEARWMQNAGCREGQGFYWCRPISKIAFLQWVQGFELEHKAAE